MPANHTTPHTAETKAKISEAKRGKPATWRHRESIELEGVILWKCGRCHGFFPKEGFYASKRTLLGIKSECKACHVATCVKSRNVELTRDVRRLSARRTRAADPEKYRQKEREAARLREWTTKSEARYELNKAVSRGEIARPDACERCGEAGRVQGHHPDYEKPFSVVWLCSECHGKEHRT